MALKSIIIKIILTIVTKTLNLLDIFLQWFGIKLCKITKETLLRGLPNGIYEELEKPDIKPFFDKYLKAHEKDTELGLSARLQIRQRSRAKLKMCMEIASAITANPEILNVEIKKPLFIIGPARTGTTYLQWLLSLDNQFRSPDYWEWLHPCPPGPVKDYTKDLRYKKTVAFLELVLNMTGPQHFAARPTEADKPSECLTAWERSFANITLLTQFSAFEDYENTLLNMGDSSAAFYLYEYHKLQLQLLAWGHDMKNKRYLLKSPYHLLMLESLLQVYPDAEFIFTHRDIVQAVPSYLSLLRAMRQLFGLSIDKHFVKRGIEAYKCLLDSSRYHFTGKD